jgi:hypothetical protein
MIAPSAAAEELIATTEDPTSIRSWRGVAVFSVFDEAARGFRLHVSRDGAAPEPLAVPVQGRPFDADVGPDSAGRPVVIYSRCRTITVVRRGGCNLYRYSLTSGRESRIAVASLGGVEEVAPTIWRGRIAWARAGDVPRIYTRALDAPRARRSQRLADIPPRLCRSGGCEVKELELRGTRLAVNFGYPGPVCNNGRILLGTVAGRFTRVAETTCGLNGQNFIGLSFDTRNLYYARFCASEPVGCGRSRFGAFRVSLSSGRAALARFGRRLTGWSYDSAGRAFEVLAPDGPNGYCGNSLPEEPSPECRVVRSDPLVFSR